MASEKNQSHTLIKYNMLVDEIVCDTQEYWVLLHMSKSQLTEWKLTGVGAEQGQ